MAIEPNTKGDLEKLGTGLHKLGQEDPSFHHQRDEENNQTVPPASGTEGTPSLLLPGNINKGDVVTRS